MDHDMQLTGWGGGSEPQPPLPNAGSLDQASLSRQAADALPHSATRPIHPSTPPREIFKDPGFKPTAKNVWGLRLLESA